MKKINPYITQLLCICLLTWSVGSSWNAYGQSGSGTDVPGIGSGSGDVASFQDCSQATNDDERNACIDHNQALTGTLGGSGVSAGSGLDSGGDINANVTHQEIAMSVFAILAALMATLYLVKCGNQISSWLFAIGALLLIIFEIINWATFTKGSETKLEALTNVDAAFHSQQVAAIDAAKQQTEEAQQWASRRATFMWIVMGIWIGATAFAIIEAIWKITTWGTYVDNCIGATVWNSSPVEQKSLYAQFYQHDDLGISLLKDETIRVRNSNDKYRAQEVEDRIFSKTSQSPSLKQYYEHQRIQGLLAGQLFFADDEKLQEKEMQQQASWMKVAMRKTLNQFIPEAQADQTEQALWDVLLVVGVALAFVGFYSGWEKVSFASGWPRAVFLAIMAVIMGWGAGIAQGKANKLKERAEAYETLKAAIVDKLRAPGAPPPATTVITSHNGGIAAPPSTSTETDTGSGLGGCTKGSPNTKVTSADCGCATTNTCTKVIEPTNIIPTNVNLEGVEGLTSMPKDLTTSSNNLARNKGLTSSVVNAGSVAFASKMKKMSDKLKAKYIDLLQKKGEQNPRSFEDMQKEFMAKVKKDMKVMDGKLTPSVLASLGVLGGSENKDADKIAAKLKELGLGQDKLAKSKTTLPNLTIAPTTNNKLFDDEPAADVNDSTKSQSMSSGDPVKSVATGDEDISKNDEVSIFEQISTRYRRSAFPRFFVKMKPENIVPSRPEAPAAP